MRTRFAPSPTGPLHLGHAFAAMIAHDLARARNGEFLLRIEDIDRARARPEWEAAILADLEWLGLPPDREIMRQSARTAAYDAALDLLWVRGLLYPCSCSRADIRASLAAPQEGDSAPSGPDGAIYPGTCRPRAPMLAPGPRPRGVHLRLDMTRALHAALGEDARAPLSFVEEGEGPGGESGQIPLDPAALLAQVGDVVLARREFGTSYHLAVAIDDAAQGISLVTRGNDLFAATAIHVLLQRLLGLPQPHYHHHRLIRDPAGKRLAKRDDARALSRYRADGATPADIRRLLGTGPGPA